MTSTRLAFHYQQADEVGDNRHALVIMAELAEELGFRITSAVSRPRVEAWAFVVEGDFDPTKLPPHVKEIRSTRLPAKL